MPRTTRKFNITLVEVRKLSEEEMAGWTGHVYYIMHHGVAKLSSTTTALRVVSNSSLNILPKGPNSLVLLLKML